MDQAKKTYQNGLKELSQGKKQYEQGKAAYDSQYAEAQAKIQAGEEGLVTYRAELDKGWAGYQTLLNTIEALKAQAAGGSGQDPDHISDFAVTADDRVKLSLFCTLHEVKSIFI